MPVVVVSGSDYVRCRHWVDEHVGVFLRKFPNAAESFLPAEVPLSSVLSACQGSLFSPAAVVRWDVPEGFTDRAVWRKVSEGVSDSCLLAVTASSTREASAAKSVCDDWAAFTVPSSNSQARERLRWAQQFWSVSVDRASVPQALWVITRDLAGFDSLLQACSLLKVERVGHADPLWMSYVTSPAGSNSLVEAIGSGDVASAVKSAVSCRENPVLAWSFVISSLASAAGPVCSCGSPARVKCARRLGFAWTAAVRALPLVRSRGLHGMVSAAGQVARVFSADSRCQLYEPVDSFLAGSVCHRDVVPSRSHEWGF